MGEPRGLINQGNTCYLNSVLQALGSSLIFADHCDQIHTAVQLVSPTGRPNSGSCRSTLTATAGAFLQAIKGFFLGSDDDADDTNSIDLPAEAAAEGQLLAALAECLQQLRPKQQHDSSSSCSGTGLADPSAVLSALRRHLPETRLEEGQQQDAAEALESICCALEHELCSWHRLQAQPFLATATTWRWPPGAAGAAAAAAAAVDGSSSSSSSSADRSSEPRRSAWRRQLLHAPSAGDSSSSSRFTQVPAKGFQASQLVCLSCGNSFAQQLQPFFVLPLGMPLDAGSTAARARLSLLQLLHLSGSPELLEGVACPRCCLHASLAALPLQQRQQLQQLRMQSTPVRTAHQQHPSARQAQLAQLAQQGLPTEEDLPALEAAGGAAGTAADAEVQPPQQHELTEHQQPSAGGCSTAASPFSAAAQQAGAGPSASQQQAHVPDDWTAGPDAQHAVGPAAAGVGGAQLQSWPSSPASPSADPVTSGLQSHQVQLTPAASSALSTAEGADGSPDSCCGLHSHAVALSCAASAAPGTLQLEVLGAPTCLQQPENGADAAAGGGETAPAGSAQRALEPPEPLEPRGGLGAAAEARQAEQAPEQQQQQQQQEQQQQQQQQGRQHHHEDAADALLLQLACLASSKLPLPELNYPQLLQQLPGGRWVQRSCGAAKRTFIARPPQLLCLHLQRSGWAPDGRPFKCSSHVSFPLMLDLEPYTRMCVLGDAGAAADLRMQYAAPSKEATASSLTGSSSSSSSSSRDYELVAVVVHLSASTSAGHYIVYVRRQEHSQQAGPSGVGGIRRRPVDRWFRMSDACAACEVELREVLGCQATLLLYEACSR